MTVLLRQLLPTSAHPPLLKIVIKTVKAFARMEVLTKHVHWVSNADDPAQMEVRFVIVGYNIVCFCGHVCRCDTVCINI